MSKKSTTATKPEHEEPPIEATSPAPKEEPTPAKEVSPRESQKDGDTQSKVKAAPEPLYILRSDDVILKEASGRPKLLGEEIGNDIVRMLSTIRPLDNWRLEVAK